MTLARHGRPTRVIRIAALDEAIMGGLMMHFMLETIIAAHLLAHIVAFQATLLGANT